MNKPARKTLLTLLSVALFMVVASAMEFAFMRIEASTLQGKLLFFFLLNLNILALLGLMYLVGKSLLRLALERRQRALGYKYKTMVVGFFLTVVSIPAVLLFVIAGELGTNYIDRFFTPQFKKPIESSIAMAQALYDMEREKVLSDARLAASGMDLPQGYTVRRLSEPPEDASGVLRDAFEGMEGSEVISGPDGDIVRAAIPLGKGVLVAESAVPASVTENIELIKQAYEDYVSLEKWEVPLKLNYLLLLGFFTLIIIFSALWVSLRLAGWITEPVRSLALATEQVASGNLRVQVSSRRRDEMGLLIESFNRMVRELREGKESLQRAFANMENIVRNIQSGVISVDAEGQVAAINDAACRILGVQAQEVTGKPYGALLQAVSSEELETLVRSINLSSLGEMEKEVPVTLKGAKRLLRVSITGLKDSVGEHMGLLVVVDDITEVIKAQRAIAWQEVARRMAHEIKNPLTPIRLSTERMLKKWSGGDKDFDAVFERSARTIIREVDGLRRLVDEFSRLGKMPEMRRAPTDLMSVVREAAALYSNYRGLTIRVEGPGELPPVPLDEEQFKRVLINILDNAAEAMGKKGTIEVLVSREHESQRFRIDIRDEGPGIPEADKEKLFMPYFSTRKNGTGLGLAIADRIVSEHGGTIRVRDGEPRGSVFTIEVPSR
jgi:two-component system nitrogen regulation sensor histidine kinase NtrY